MQAPRMDLREIVALAGIFWHLSSRECAKIRMSRPNGRRMAADAAAFEPEDDGFEYLSR